MPSIFVLAKRIAPGALLAALLLFSACSKDAGPTAPKHDARAEAKAFYAAHPEFFHFKTPADVPKSLKWDDGMDLPEFSDPAAQRGGTLNFWIQDFPRTLRYVGPDSNGSFRPWILDNNAMQFAQRHPDVTALTPDGFRHYPGIADRWALDRATRTVYVHINPTARWSDGVPITTEDVFFSHFFFRSRYIREPWYNNYYTTKYTGLTRFDDLTFALTFPVLRPDILTLALENEPVAAHFFAALGDDYPARYQWQLAPTSGPYTIRPEDIDKGRAITLTHIKHWWAETNQFWRHRFNPDRIRLTVIRDNAKALEAFRKGDLDFFDLDLAENWYDKLPDTDPLVRHGFVEKIKFYNDIPRPTYGLWLNESRPLLDNRDIRIGIQFAADWDLVVQKLGRGDWTRMQTTSDGYGEFTSPAIRARRYDVDAALASFARAGFTQRGPDGILVNAAGQRLSLQLTTGYERFRDVLTILQEAALKAGLELRVEVLDSTAAWKKAQEKKHDIMFSAFNISPEMFPRYWEMFHSANAYDQAFLPDGSVNPDRKVKTQTNNLSEVASPELDRMIETYDQSADLTEMKDLAYRMQQFLHDNAAFCPGFVTPYIRTGVWRWVRMPPAGNVKIARAFWEFSLYWIDAARKQETAEAMRTGRAFPPVIKVYDQFRMTEGLKN